MPDYIIEYLLTQVRIARVTAGTEEAAREEVKRFNAQLDTHETDEIVIILKVDIDE